MGGYGGVRQPVGYLPDVLCTWHTSGPSLKKGDGSRLMRQFPVGFDEPAQRGWFLSLCLQRPGPNFARLVPLPEGEGVPEGGV